MKIGFSFGRCVRDIVKGEVCIDDVLVIICRTAIPDIDMMAHVLKRYAREPAYLMGLDPSECLDVATELWETGKLHQPRIAGFGGLIAADQDAVWADVVPTTAMDGQVLDAWRQYRFLLSLNSDIPSSDKYR
jgi:hypothetical protein